MMASRAKESQLFILRLWVEDLGDGRFEIRGQIRHTPTGDLFYFRKWSAMQDFVLRRLSDKDQTAGR